MSAPARAGGVGGGKGERRKEKGEGNARSCRGPGRCAGDRRPEAGDGKTQAKATSSREGLSRLHSTAPSLPLFLFSDCLVFPSPVSRLPSPVCRLPPPVSRLPPPISDLARPAVGRRRATTLSTRSRVPPVSSFFFPRRGDASPRFLFSSASDLSSVLRRRRPDDLLERLREMEDVAEPELVRDLLDRVVAVIDRRARPLEPATLLMLPR